MSFTNHRIRRISGIVSTDDIIPARYKHMHTRPTLLAPHLFESYLPGFVETLRPGDAIVSDSIFGIGSSREQAVSTLLANGVSAIFAPRFGRIFFRNCWNLAIPAIEIDGTNLKDMQTVELDLDSGLLRSDGGEELTSFPPPPGFLLSMIRSGGLLNQVREHMNQEENTR